MWTSRRSSANWWPARRWRSWPGPVTPTAAYASGEWEAVWDLQRAEDRGEQVGPIGKPPEYKKPDFTGVGWAHRGKLDVPKERFIA